MKNNRIWIVGTALVTLAILVLGYLLGIAPKLAEAADADAQTAQVVEANRVKNVELQNLKSQFKLIEGIKKELAGLQVALPATPEYSDFIRDLNSYADKAGVILYAATTSSVTPATVTIASPTTVAPPTATTAAPVNPSPAPSTSGAPPAAPANTGATFNAVPITITVRGSYVQVTKFIGLLQAGSRIVLVLTVDYHVPDNFPGYEVAIGGAVFTLANTPGYPDVVDGADKVFATATPSPSPSNTSTPSPSETAVPTSTPSPSK